MIEKVHIKNFKCFKDFQVDLGPFNVLIGPNDCGKTAFLQAIRIMYQVKPLSHNFIKVLQAALGISLGMSVIWRQNEDLEPELYAKVDESIKESKLQFAFSQKKTARQEVDREYEWVTDIDEIMVDLRANKISEEHMSAFYQRHFRDARYIQFNAQSMREPSPLSENKFELNPNGEGLARYVTHIWDEDRDSFLQLENEFYKRFPEYKSIKFTDKKRNHQLGKALDFVTCHDEALSSSEVSDGVILSLGFLALCHSPCPPQVLLIEEPENGLHPYRLNEVIGTLRYLSENKGVQIIVTTHSPYLLDRVEPEQVRFFQKDEEGAVQAFNMGEIPAVQEMKNHFMTGEIWTTLTEERMAKERAGK